MCTVETSINETQTITLHGGSAATDNLHTCNEVPYVGGAERTEPQGIIYHALEVLWKPINRIKP